ncbi:MAG: hypothetical protein JWO85_2240 [Candidatus Eremiobacteraeota bacterium]|nr:hypothetical protein [Candidatus Eremiobacteraeota bacterium]
MLAGILGSLEGQARGSHDANLDAIKRSQADRDYNLQEQQLELQRQQNERQSKLADANAAKITSETEAANTQLAASRAFEKGLKRPDGWATMSASDKIGYLSKRADAAFAAGDMEVVHAAQAEATAIGLNEQRLANADYTSGARTDLTRSTIGVNDARITLLKAQAKATADLPARARAIAAGHDQAAWQRATAQINSRAEIAQYNGVLRTNLAQLAGAYHLQGMDYAAATRAAVDQYNQLQSDYRQQMTPAAQLTRDPNAPAPQMPQLQYPPAPTINYNLAPLPMLPGATPPTTMLDPRTGQPVLVQPGAGPNGSTLKAPVPPKNNAAGSRPNATPPTSLPPKIARLASAYAAEIKANPSFNWGSDIDASNLLTSAEKLALKAAIARGSANAQRTPLQPPPVPGRPAIQGISPYLLPGQ